MEKEFDVDCRCYCGVHYVLKTSWTDENPCRRFLGCSNYRDGNGCNYFDWIDPPILNRKKSTFLSLLRRNESSEVRLHRIENKWEFVEGEMQMLRADIDRLEVERHSLEENLRNLEKKYKFIVYVLIAVVCYSVGRSIVS
ncbi:GRF zinc finger containing protein [Abeliophyllum distichum]|uniref:GRF zinc finger containing protein n=1 Tax=Abeliophyllum distichum TaxID=126358 RepID=A0ABD1QXX9_9LAMI